MKHGFAEDIEHIGLIKRLPSGRIIQIGMTQEQQTMLKISLGAISQDKPMVQMPEQYDLVLKSEVENV